MKYVAFLRGIGPGNPNMRNDKLRGVFEDLGFTNVQSVISSGNILFESDEADITKLERLIEKAWPDKLGFNSTTIVRNRQKLGELLGLNPFKNLTHGRGSYLMVTFFKHPVKHQFKFPYHPPDKPYYFPAATDNALFSVMDNTRKPASDLMAWMEKHYGKEITSRTWNTAQRIFKKLDE